MDMIYHHVLTLEAAGRRKPKIIQNGAKVRRLTFIHSSTRYTVGEGEITWKMYRKYITSVNAVDSLKKT